MCDGNFPDRVKFDQTVEWESKSLSNNTARVGKNSTNLAKLLSNIELHTKYYKLEQKVDYENDVLVLVSNLLKRKNLMLPAEVQFIALKNSR